MTSPVWRDGCREPLPAPVRVRGSSLPPGASSGRAHRTSQRGPPADPLPTGVRHPSSCPLCPWDFLRLPRNLCVGEGPWPYGAAPPGVVCLTPRSILAWSQEEPVGLKHMFSERGRGLAPAAGWSVVSVGEGLPDWTSFSPQTLIQHLPYFQHYSTGRLQEGIVLFTRCGLSFL